MRPNLSLLPAFASLWLTLISPLAAQSPGDAGQKPGIAMVKPQAWSKDDQAAALEFQAVSNHTGYYQFRTEKNPAYQVPSAKVVTLIFFPVSPAEITSAPQRAALQKTIDDLAASGKRFPSAARAVDQAVAPLKSDAEKFDAGSVKVNGQWISRAVYFQQKAGALADLLRPEILAAPKIKDFDLAADQYFIGLQELASSEASVRPVIAGIQSLYDSVVRKQDRAELLRQLNAGGLTFDQAAELVKKLKTLQPQEDAAANLFVQSWDTATGKASQLTAQIKEVQGQFESSMPEAGPSVPALSPELAASIGKMADAVRQYRSGTPPAAIQVPLQTADAMVAFADNLPVLDKRIKARELLDAKSILDPLLRQAELIGPKTSAAIAGTQKNVNGDVEKFLILRNEAKMLADGDKIEEALKKYEQAYAIVAAKDVAAQIEALKKQ